MPMRSVASSASRQTTASVDSRWTGSSPSRRSPVRNGLRSPDRETRRYTLDWQSPSRQMVIDFNHLLIKSDQEFTHALDKAGAEKLQEYQEQLAEAAAEHERVRAGAELEFERLAEVEKARKLRQEQEQQREYARAREERERLEAEARQRELEEKRREEEAVRKAAEERRKIVEAEARIKAQKEKDEAAQRAQAQQEATEKKAREDADRLRIQQAQQPTAPTPATQPAVTAPATNVTSAGATDAEAIHSKYIELHQRMKAFWKPFKQECGKPGHPLKAVVGEVRRGMQKKLGQVTVQRENSKAVIGGIRQIFEGARAAGGPTVDIRPYIVSSPLPTLANESEAQYPAIMLYALICFEKSLVKQFDQEAGHEDGKIITELGIIAASFFADPHTRWKDIPLTDLLLAKLHRVCPILFGITGDMKSANGMARLGFLPVDGEQRSPNEYHQRMQGIGAGFAAMSLRKVAHPTIPPSEYWRALASIANTPSNDLYNGHFMVLKGMVRDYVPKLVDLYGVYGLALVRQATVVMPRRAPSRTSSTVGLVTVLPDVWRKRGINLAG
ncbi:hypothetical protein M011DRAFT_402739 [Sporormia fimetaria CBS 119925]|uniref:mRNA export factor GLE1 n=1 Tax=Sporormia fimetaria CBS 119925 TaxID=1340428 RepID=A0A6A6VBP3_9PLEO|nr:hypothetical protein M011DRAFT_402739 [Sporormia fimetaria CBS 119925]